MDNKKTDERFSLYVRVTKAGTMSCQNYFTSAVGWPPDIAGKAQLADDDDDADDDHDGNDNQRDDHADDE